MYRRVIVGLTFALLSLFALATAEPTEVNKASSPTVPVIFISGAIGPAVGDYVIKEIQRVNVIGHSPAIIITIDTPGGLSSSLRDINQHILASKVPVLCLVHPPGARAASAGTYILYACHIAAMSTATTLGAATPVQIGGVTPGGDQQKEKPSEPTAMEKKILNDSIAYIRSLAQLRGRNVEWAEKAVRDAETLSANEALELNVINLMAESPQELLTKLDGTVTKIDNQDVVLELASATLEPREPDLRNKFIATITDPNVAYILMMIGVYGLLLEFYSPSFGVAGVTGAICLLIALYAFQLLPVNYVGLGLILLGIALFIAESLIPSFGILGAGGIVAFVLGSVFLIDSDLPELRVSMSLIYSIAFASAALIVFILKMLMKLRHKQVVSGEEALIGHEAIVLNDFNRHGFVHVEGERWEARCDHPVNKGEKVSIESVDGLTLKVKKVPRSEDNA
ncbi:NfeD family protein [Vibrio japonicus]|uniref:Nodulation protein NfeD n=1 Tax=Vibrio japonicus TaxID=1824638 RepID=A0ABY5LMR9_9VIBR|nr:nodulation protein NfeD [Vibrio japonicus]UUM32412.1 nodulation protein NfeD [Vibrio japonicus]